MRDDEIRQALRATLDDRRVTRGERKALRALLDAANLDRHRREVLRAHAFDLARTAVEGPRAEKILGWLDDVVGLLLQTGERAGDDTPEPAEVWFSPGEGPLACIVQNLRRVRARLDVCVFTITDDRISEGILSAARRGVAVRLISDDDKSGDKGSDLERFRTAGVPVALDRSPAHMHHKFALFDGARLLTGSFNWTRSASGENHENLLVTGDPRLIAAYQSEFDRLWQQYR